MRCKLIVPALERPELGDPVSLKCLGAALDTHSGSCDRRWLMPLSRCPSRTGNTDVASAGETMTAGPHLPGQSPGELSRALLPHQLASCSRGLWPARKGIAFKRPNVTLHRLHSEPVHGPHDHASSTQSSISEQNIRMQIDSRGGRTWSWRRRTRVSDTEGVQAVVSSPVCLSTASLPSILNLWQG